MTILDLKLAEAKFAVLDLETTGLRPGVDDIVEISVVWVDPGVLPVIALDTLIRPPGHLAGTEVHGIGEEDLVGAPRLDELVADVLAALSDRIVVGHNVSFDLRFLAEALMRWGPLEPPVVDTRALGALLGDARGSLTDMCAAVGIARSTAHVATVDAIDTARLLAAQLARAHVLSCGRSATSAGEARLRAWAPGRDRCCSRRTRRGSRAPPHGVLGSVRSATPRCAHTPRR